MKWFGVVLVILGCGGLGLRVANQYRREERLLTQLLRHLQWMQCELRCHVSDLSWLFRSLMSRSEGVLRSVFEDMTGHLESRVAPDADFCMKSALGGHPLPDSVTGLLLRLGRSLGEFDLEGQLSQLHAVEEECSRILEEHSKNRDSRVRSYQTLGLCAGFALAILLL